MAEDKEEKQEKQMFVATFPLKTEKWQEDLLNKRLRILTQAWNEALSASLKALKGLWESDGEYRELVRYFDARWHARSTAMRERYEAMKDGREPLDAEFAGLYEKYVSDEAELKEKYAPGVPADKASMAIYGQVRDRLCRLEIGRSGPGDGATVYTFRPQSISNMLSKWNATRRILGVVPSSSGMFGYEFSYLGACLETAFDKAKLGFEAMTANRHTRIRFRQLGKRLPDGSVDRSDEVAVMSHSRESSGKFTRKELDYGARCLVIQTNDRRKASERRFMRIPIGFTDSEYDRRVLELGEGAVRVISIVRGNPNSERPKFYLHLTIEGTPHSKGVLGRGVVGIDVGPRMVALCGEGEACKKWLSIPSRNKARVLELQKKVSRSLQLNNPECYDEKGAVKKGARFKHVSLKCRKMQARIKDLQGKASAERKQVLNETANKVLAMGDTFVVEDNNIRWWQMANHGTSILEAAPSEFIRILTYKAAFLGGKVIRVPCGIAATQFDFTDEEFHPHEIGERKVTLSNGDTFDRDIMAAFNLRHVTEALLDKCSGKVKAKARKRLAGKDAANFDVAGMERDYAGFRSMAMNLTEERVADR